MIKKAFFFFILTIFSTTLSAQVNIPAVKTPKPPTFQNYTNSVNKNKQYVNQPTTPNIKQQELHKRQQHLEEIMQEYKQDCKILPTSI